MLRSQMAMRKIDGIPKNYQILHAEQEVESHDMSSLQCILNSDVERTQLLQEEVTLLALQRESKLHNATGSNKGRVNEVIHKDQNSQRLAKIYTRLECIDADNAKSGLVGRNCTRKTILCRQMAMHGTDRIPMNYQILHTKKEIEGDDMSASQCILNSDVERTQLLQEEVTSLALQRESKLHNATESSKGRLNEGIHKDQNSQRLAEIYKRLECIDAENPESGLVGNGTGKTTFLRQMALRAVDGIPENCKILHVEQEIEGDDMSALQCILNSEVKGTQMLQEEVTFLDLQRISELDNATENNNEMVNEGIDKDQISHRFPEIYKRLKFIDADAVESRAASVLLVDCNGTTNIIVKIYGGYLVAVEARKTKKIHIDNEPVRILKSDDAVKHMVAGNGVIITCSGSAKRCDSILKHIKEVVKVNDDVIAIRTHIAKYVGENVLAAGSKGATMFVVGRSFEGQCRAYREGDDRPQPLTDNYATIGSGGPAAQKELRRLGHTKEGALFDLERSIEDIYKAMLQSVVKDRSSGGKISVLMVTADYCGELSNPIAIELARHFKMPFCNRTELFVFTNSPYEDMNYWYLQKYFESLGSSVTEEPTCFGIITNSWKLFRVKFETKNDLIGIFSSGERCVRNGFHKLRYARGQGKSRVDCDLFITAAHRRLLDPTYVSTILESAKKRDREDDD